MTRMRFLALPVKEGDAFYLMRDGKHILVDGGRGSGVVRLLRQYSPGLSKLDVVACTHNDRDHTEGLIHLLKEKKLKIGCLLLPAVWLDLCKRYQGQERKFLEELSRELQFELQRRWNRLPDIQALAEKVVRDNEGSPLNEDHNDDQPLNLINAEMGALDVAFLDEELSKANNVINNACRRECKLERFFGLCEDKNFYRGFSRIDHIKLYKTILSLMKNILELMRLANERRLSGEKLEIHYFERGDRWVAAPVRHLLEVVNAREITTEISENRCSLLCMLCLSVSNEMSLAFMSPEDDEHPGILFCGDGSFELSGKNPRRRIICTAPHHGSGADLNVLMYQRVNDWAKAGAIWVRSDRVNPAHENKKRPCKAYVSQMMRFCTRCNTKHSAYEDQLIEIFVSGNEWSVPKHVRACDCKAR